MIARFAGGMLGLLAFTVATLVGLAAGNPPTVILSRALWGLVVFCLIGLAVGMAAQAVIDEYMSREEARLFRSDPRSGDASKQDQSPAADAQPMGTE